MASSNDWGLTDRGFRRPTYAELLNALEFKARELFGSKVNLTVRSPLGLFLRIFAWVLNLLFSTIEDVYNSRFIDTAVGTSLLNLGRAIGLRLLAAQQAVGYLLITGDDGTPVPAGWLGATNAGTQYVVVADGVITDSSVLLPARCMIHGPEGNTAANTIIVIVNPMDGITSVTNPALFDGGRNTETDAEFRERYYVSVDFAGGVNIDAIAAEVLQNVEGVYSAKGYENYTDHWDYIQNLPPHSFEVVVYGGLDEDIARQIFRRKAAGIQTWGSTTVPVFSASGQLFDILFSRPDPVHVYIQISNLVTNPSAFPQDGQEQIAQALIRFIGGNVRGGLPIGEDVVFIRLPCVILNATSGVIDFDLQISRDGVTFGQDNIPVSTRQKAVTDRGSVTFI
jgi:uncharacterized phage protein gp47/JayE